MRVWLADDKEDELLPDICAFQKARAPKNLKRLIREVHVVGVASIGSLRDRIESCCSGADEYPDLIFLDLAFENREDGIEALRFIKYHGNPDVRKIPVIMYSQSDSASDVYVTMVYRANAYLTKSGLRDFWTAVTHWQTTQLPPYTAPEDVGSELSASDD